MDATGPAYTINLICEKSRYPGDFSITQQAADLYADVVQYSLADVGV